MVDCNGVYETETLIVQWKGRKFVKQIVRLMSQRKTIVIKLQKKKKITK